MKQQFGEPIAMHFYEDSSSCDQSMSYQHINNSACHLNISTTFSERCQRSPQSVLNKSFMAASSPFK